MLDINGASALVTGGASGLGEASVRALGAAGAKVVIMDLEHQADKAEVILKDVDGAFMPCDVTNTEQVIAAVEKAKELGPPKALVNSAGIGWATRTIGKDGTYESAHDLELFRKVIDINLVGTFNCIRLAATAMSQNDPDEDGQRGAIVNTASIAAVEGQIGQASYTASKAGVVGITLVCARDLAAVGVRVNTIIPGLFDTPIYGQGEASEQFKERLSVGTLFPKRLGDAAEYASLALELIRNTYINGESVRIDSGMRMQPK
jgi:NAD(P)-dependent dehydrogenase (short-subunit alcohol dehydrogenase family)